MNDAIDLYCERLGPGLWAEPVNAITNLAFIIAAFLAWRLAREHRALKWDVALLVALLAVIGVGSALFHTFATGWAQLADVLPILLFQVVFLFSYAWRVMQAGWVKTLLLFAGFLGLGVVFGQFPREWLNGSLGYAPAFMYIFGFGIYHVVKRKTDRWVLIAAAVCFLVSLTFRSLDMALCDVFPLGVHFFWHLLNGGVLYLCLRGLILNIR